MKFIRIPICSIHIFAGLQIANMSVYLKCPLLIRTYVILYLGLPISSKTSSIPPYISKDPISK